ncbi:MAG: hypothetical protein H6735_13790 [Alphaproteobacteria bacterium]|nr:hypothetical protein [Alphaproteobacteria bacterium]
MKSPVWPVLDPPGDPWAEPLPQNASADEEALFVAATTSVWRGAEEPELRVLAARLGRPGVLGPDPNPLPIGDRLPTEADLVRVAADHDPCVVAEGGDRVLGPFAQDAEPAAMRAAVALAAFLVGEDADVSPVDRWLRETAGELEHKLGFRAARAAPLLPYAVTVTGADQVSLRPLLSQGASAPTGPVPWRSLPAPAGGDGSVVFARVARTSSGFRPVTGITVPGWPAEAERWASWLAFALRRPTVEDLGRSLGHVLLRRVLECGW